MKKITHENRLTITFADGEKITATASKLNLIACAFFEAAERYEELTCISLAKEARAHAERISAELTRKGYFDK